MWWRLLIAKLFNKRVVWLETHSGAVYLRLARSTPFGLTGHLWPTSKLGPFTCLPNGTCRGASYIERWKPADGQ